MDLTKWKKGLKLCFSNAVRLRDDGELLLNNGSYGHAYFSFYTAMEELGLALIILKSFKEPKPKELQKFVRSKQSHQKKSMLNVFDFFKEEIKNLNLPKDYLKKLWESGKTYEQFIAEKLDKKLGIWEKRNRGIYLSLNKNYTYWLTPQDITPDDSKLLRKKLIETIESWKGTMAFLERHKMFD